MRVSSVIAPVSFRGTLKSTRTRTRFPLRSEPERLARERFAMGLCRAVRKRGEINTSSAVPELGLTAAALAEGHRHV